MGSFSCQHFAIFPFMSQGHTIPLLYLSRLLRRRSVSVTIFTTAGNSPAIRASLNDVDVSIIQLPFPQNIPGVPPGVENTDKLSFTESFLPFAKSTVSMKESFEQALESLQPPVSCIISDVFLGWTLKSAQKFHVPRISFSGMGNFSYTMYHVLGKYRPHVDTDSEDQYFVMPDFPNIKLTRNDFSPPFNEINPSGPCVEFITENIIAVMNSYGMIVNSFYKLESCYIDYLANDIPPKTWNIGPLCVTREIKLEKANNNSHYMQWLDEKLEKGESVLYVSFGTQAEVSREQYLEIARGLEKSGVSFLWALKSDCLDFLPGFESRVENRCLIVRDWVDQLKILRHDGVKGILSHCGWNSVMESMSAGVPILALPFMAEQHTNARFVVEEIGVGLRVMPRGGSVKGDVDEAEVEAKVRELMGGENAAEVRRKVAEFRDAAWAAMKEGGSSWLDLDLLITDTCEKVFTRRQESKGAENGFPAVWFFPLPLLHLLLRLSPGKCSSTIILALALIRSCYTLLHCPGYPADSNQLYI